jgi:hypothetical protein
VLTLVTLVKFILAVEKVIRCPLLVYSLPGPVARVGGAAPPPPRKNIKTQKMREKGMKLSSFASFGWQNRFVYYKRYDLCYAFYSYSSLLCIPILRPSNILVAYQLSIFSGVCTVVRENEITIKISRGCLSCKFRGPIADWQIYMNSSFTSLQLLTFILISLLLETVSKNTLFAKKFSSGALPPSPLPGALSLDPAGA